MNPFERDLHLLDVHEADEGVVERNDSRQSRDLHRFLHSMTGALCDHEHEEGEW